MLCAHDAVVFMSVYAYCLLVDTQVSKSDLNFEKAIGVLVMQFDSLLPSFWKVFINVYITIQTHLYPNKKFCHTMQNHCAHYNNYVVLLISTPFDHMTSLLLLVECHLYYVM